VTWMVSVPPQTLWLWSNVWSTQNENGEFCLFSFSNKIRIQQI